MKLKGIRTIALLVAAVVLAIGSVAGMVVAGAEDRSSDEGFREGFRSDEGWRMDARYWWEAPPVTPYEREQIREIMVLVVQRYFGIDISAMSPEEFEEMGRALGPEKEAEILHLFGHYAEKRGFEIPSGILDMPDGSPPPWEEAPVTPAEKYTPPAWMENYWWERVTNAEQSMGELIARIVEIKEVTPHRAKEVFPQIFPVVDVWSMTREEFERFLNDLLWNMTFAEFRNFVDNLPPRPLRLVSIDEVKQSPYVIAVYGKVPRLSTQAEIREFRDKLKTVINALTPRLFEYPIAIVSSGLTGQGAIWVGVLCDEAPVGEIYEMISEKAEGLLGIQDVAVIFERSFVIEDSFIPPSPMPGYGEHYRPIIGGVRKEMFPWQEVSTIGFAVREPIPWWFDDLDYVITGHLGPARTPVNAQVYQPIIAAGNEAGKVSDVASMDGFADVARVAVHNWHVDPYIHIGEGIKDPVECWRDPVVSESVWMSGQTSGLTVGSVVDVGVPIASPTFGTLHNQVVATYHSAGGDSGAPIHGLVNGTLTMFGVHGGRVFHNGALRRWFSPISGVRIELPGWYPHTK